CEQWNGFSNRFMWICARRANVFSSPEALTEAGIGQEIAALIKATSFAKQVEEMERGKDAEELWAEIYNRIAENETEGVVGASIERADAIMLRLQMLYALSTKSPIVRREPVQAAQALWQYAEDSARYLFGARLGNPRAEKIFDALRQAPQG